MLLPRVLCALALASILHTGSVALTFAEPAVSAASTAIVVTQLGPALAVTADDGLTHLEYDLLVSNVFNAAVALTSVLVVDGSGAVLMRLDGDRLRAVTQTLLEQKPVTSIPASGMAAVEVDLALPQGRARRFRRHEPASSSTPTRRRGSLRATTRRRSRSRP